jgi:hypothetical protein
MKVKWSILHLQCIKHNLIWNRLKPFEYPAAIATKNCSMSRVPTSSGLPYHCWSSNTPYNASIKSFRRGYDDVLPNCKIVYRHSSNVDAARKMRFLRLAFPPGNRITLRRVRFVKKCKTYRVAECLRNINGAQCVPKAYIYHFRPVDL